MKVFIFCAIFFGNIYPACCGSSSVAIKPEAYKHSSAQVLSQRATPSSTPPATPEPLPLVKGIDIHRAKKVVESYKKSHPKEVVSLKSRYNNNEFLIDWHIASAHVRSQSRHLDHVRPALAQLIST